MQRHRRAAVVGFLLAVIGGACGGDGPTTPTGPTFPDLRGSYIVQGSTRATIIGTGQVGSGSCRGTLSITSQTGGNFSGTITCDDEEGIVNGSVRPDGTIPVFSTRSTEPSGCQFISGQRDYSGAVGGRIITVQRSQVVVCGSLTANREQTIVATR